MLVKSFFVALATYSAIPVPQFAWTEDSMKYALCFFPAVGVFCGGGLWLWYELCCYLGVSAVLFAAVAAALPLLITGGIHMDGFMDTVDALSSHQSRERKLEILKDSRCGAFGALYCGIYLLLSFGLLHELYAMGEILVLLPAFVLSRSLSALCAVTMPSAREGGMLRAYTRDAAKLTAVIAAVVAAMLAAAGMVTISLVPALAALGCALLAMICYRRFAMKVFGGVTGDTAGFFLQLCELAVLLGTWIGGVV